MKEWAGSKIGNIKLLMCVARQLIGILDVVQEFRQLSAEEIQLRRGLKLRILGMAAVEKLRCKQASEWQASGQLKQTQSCSIYKLKGGKGKFSSQNYRRAVQL